MAGTDHSGYHAEYAYDAAGNRISVTDSGNTVRYNLDESGNYQADPLNRINTIERNFDHAAYTTAYQYNKAGLLTRIKYPEASGWLEYRYNNLNQLNEVVGFTPSNGIQYEADGALQNITYGNGVMASFHYDVNRRLKDLAAASGVTEILGLSYIYDNADNIKQIIDNGRIKLYEYDKNNQLTKAVTPGKHLDANPVPGTYGLKEADYRGSGWMDFAPILNGLIGLDYYSSSIAIDFGSVAGGIRKILLAPDQNYIRHRLVDRHLGLYVSNDNMSYSLIPRTSWDYVKDANGVITITLKETVATRYLKLHVKFDDRHLNISPKNKATFLNEVAKMLQVYQEADSRTEEYQYDAAGNRKLLKVTLVRTTEFASQYYTNSDRLKTDGKYAFVYDQAGNMVKKGNVYTINGDTVNFTKTSGAGVEYWEYKYDLLDRLIKVTKNGNMVAEYGYDPEGLRVVKRAKSETSHYVFEGTDPIFEKNITTGKIKSFIYALGKHLARVDGAIGDSNAKKYWYVTDHVGSIRAVTDKDGKKVWSADYFTFGTQFGKSGETDFEELHSFTGKEYDPDTGLHYYNARWYDADLGRFISEDPVADPNNPNLYSYCNNNPGIFVDPTGLSYGNPSDPGTMVGPVNPRSGREGSSSSPSTSAGKGGNDGSGRSPSSQGEDSNENDNSNNNELSSQVKSDREQQLQMDKQRLVDQRTILENQLRNTDPSTELFNKLAEQYIKTKNAIEYINNQLYGKNPSRTEVIDYIKEECERIGLPVEIGLAIAWTESRMQQFDKNGKPVVNENKDKNDQVVSADWGIMQINDKAWKGVYDFDSIKSNWQYNVRAGLEIALGNYNAAVKAGETNVARATYSGYNAGQSNIGRYRTGNDSRDQNFWGNYQNALWNK